MLSASLFGEMGFIVPQAAPVVNPRPFFQPSMKRRQGYPRVSCRRSE